MASTAKFTLRVAFDVLRQLEVGGHWEFCDYYFRPKTLDEAITLLERDHPELLESPASLSEDSVSFMRLRTQHVIWELRPHAVEDVFDVIFIPDKK